MKNKKYYRNKIGEFGRKPATSLLGIALLVVITSYAFGTVYSALGATLIAMEPNVPKVEINPVRGQIEAQASYQHPVAQQIHDLAVARDFRWPSYLVRLAKCESRFNPLAVGDGGYYSRGAFQISKFYHPNVSDECAFDVTCSAHWTMDKIEAGGQGIWSCNKIVKGNFSY